MSASKQKTAKDSASIDWSRVEHYLRQELPDLPEGNLQVQRFSEGYSNLTYLLTIGEWEGVLRRPPFGEVPPKAHDMEREYRMLSKVNPVFPLAPEPYVYCEDPDVMDKHFYVMEKKQGVVLDDKLPDFYGPSEEAGPKISDTVVTTLVGLQEIGYREAGLAEMGRPEGFLERQVNGWIRRYDRSKTDSIPQLQDLEQWFIRNLPVNDETTIVHNDFKLNNMVLDPNDSGKAVGILDWELSTIGDPLSDLGSAVAYWGQAGDPDMGINIITNQPGFWSRREFVEKYAQRSGRDLSQADYYVAFGFYKLGVILQQIYYRWKTGEIDDDRFKELNKAVANLFELADLTRQGRIL